MVWLQNNERYGLLAELDERSGNFMIHDRTRLGSRVPATLSGTFTLFGSTFAALYASEGRLLFRLGESIFELDDTTVVRVSGPAHARTLRVERQGRVVAQQDYVASLDAQFEDDPTPFVDDEDFDFGLAVSNVSLDRARKDRLRTRA